MRTRTRPVSGAARLEMLESRLLLAADWTYLVYLDADNNLETDGLINVNQMEPRQGNETNAASTLEGARLRASRPRFRCRAIEPDERAARARARGRARAPAAMPARGTAARS